MDKRYEKYSLELDKHKELLLEAERYLWKNPEPGYREWKTHKYLKALYEKFGYEVTEAGDIPGFYVDIDTGIPGPKLAIFGEMDSLIVPAHPECDLETGAVHACGHHLQSVALLGIAIALKAPGALDGMCGSIRLLAVPAEEGIEISFRRELRSKGVIKFFSGKMEYLSRGYLEGVDLAMMVHASDTPGMACPSGTNGNVLKRATFIGKSAHAGGSPHKGINALYAATTALSAANALRETFQEKDFIRFHPILSKGGNVVNAIPDEVISESYVRGADFGAIRDASKKINRAYAGAAAAMGCRVYFEDQYNHAPRINDKNFREAFHQVALNFFPEEDLNFNKAWGAGCSDMGDISCIMPTVHPYVGGTKGTSHSASYYVVDAEKACVTGAKVQAGVAHLLLSDGAAYAKKIIDEAYVPFDSVEKFFKSVAEMSFEGDGVIYNEDGSVTLRY